MLSEFNTALVWFAFTFKSQCKIHQFNHKVYLRCQKKAISHWTHDDQLKLHFYLTTKSDCQAENELFYWSSVQGFFMIISIKYIKQLIFPMISEKRANFISPLAYRSWNRSQFDDGLDKLNFDCISILGTCINNCWHYIRQYVRGNDNMPHNDNLNQRILKNNLNVAAMLQKKIEITLQIN